MKRYLLILLLGCALLSWGGPAWAQEEGTEQSNPFRQPEQKKEQAAENPEDDKILFKQLPELSLKGILKFKGEEPVGLLEIVYEGKKKENRTELYRVRKGDQISITIPGEDVLKKSDLEPPPPPPQPATQPGQAGQANQSGQANQGQAQAGNAQGTGNTVGVRTRPSPKITLKEIQVIFEIKEISRQGLAIEALPLRERILVR